MAIVNGKPVLLYVQRGPDWTEAEVRGWWKDCLAALRRLGGSAIPTQGARRRELALGSMALGVRCPVARSGCDIGFRLDNVKLAVTLMLSQRPAFLVSPR